MRFLTKDWSIYDVEVLSKVPQLQAILQVMLPARPVVGFAGTSIYFYFPAVFHTPTTCARLSTPDDHLIWTTNPADRVICVHAVFYWIYSLAIFVISALFFPWRSSRRVLMRTQKMGDLFHGQYGVHIIAATS